MTTSVLAATLAGVAVLAAWPPQRFRASVGWDHPPDRRASGRDAATYGVSPATPDLLALLDMVGAQVRAGAEPSSAWAAAVETCGIDVRGDDPVHALDAVAATAAATGALHRRWVGRHLRATALETLTAAASARAAWQLARRTGAPLADLLDSVCASVRADREDRTFLDAATAGPQATARLLLALPVAGIGLGQLVGAQPLNVLVGTGAGRACGLVGLLLLVVGRLWMRRLVHAVEAAGRPARQGIAW